MTFAATSQPDVFKVIETGEYFPHDGRHPLSQSLALLQQVGQADIVPYVPPDYAAQRLAAYRQAITQDAFQEAFFEYLAGRPAKAEALQVTRTAIATAFPKPA